MKNFLDVEDFDLVVVLEKHVAANKREYELQKDREEFDFHKKAKQKRELRMSPYKREKNWKNKI